EEIEATLRQHPAVHEAVVLAREDTPGDKRLVAYVTPLTLPSPPSDGGEGRVRGEEATPAGLRRHLKERLPVYMVPAAVVLLEKMPLTPNGKVDRKALPAPDFTQLERDTAYVAPRDPTEEALARIWSEVLGLPQVGIDDDFFGLGGHSLKATQVIARIRRQFQVDLPLQALFDSPTVAGLALALHKLGASAPAVAPAGIAPLQGDRTRTPASSSQQRLWFLDQFIPNPEAYNLCEFVHLQGALDVESFRRAF